MLPADGIEPFSRPRCVYTFNYLPSMWIVDIACLLSDRAELVDADGGGWCAYYAMPSSCSHGILPEEGS